MPLRDLFNAFGILFAGLANFLKSSVDWLHDLGCKVGIANFFQISKQCQSDDWRDLSIGQVLFILIIAYTYALPIYENARAMGRNAVISRAIALVFGLLAFSVSAFTTITIADSEYTNFFKTITFFPFGLLIVFAAFFALLLIGYLTSRLVEAVAMRCFNKIHNKEKR